MVTRHAFKISLNDELPTRFFTNHQTNRTTSFHHVSNIKTEQFRAVPCICNASGFCGPVTHDAPEVVMSFWHLSGIDRSDKQLINEAQTV